mmetsp:Transcript_21165/g.29675  ORF Transcript_21165/g.29675 Transcript_21165/m.29675 type:complete len:126 (-) Transcript_21165:168-545(-)
MLLLVVVFTQTCLFICSMLSPKLGLSFFGSNFVLSIVGIWMLESRRPRPALLYLAVLLFTIINDATSLSFFGALLYDDGFAGMVSLGSCLLSLFVKPLLSVILYQEISKRGGTLNIKGFHKAMRG